jgi:hypothetical protein
VLLKYSSGLRIALIFIRLPSESIRGFCGILALRIGSDNLSIARCRFRSPALFIEKACEVVKRLLGAAAL